MYAEALHSNHNEQIVAPQVGRDVFSSISTLARDCAMRCHYESEEAAAMLLRRMQQEHADWYAKKQREAMMLWALGEVRRVPRDIRGTIADPKRSAALGAISLRDMALGWLQWVVCDGVEMKDATKATLLTTSREYIGIAATYSARGRWYQAIAEKLPSATAKVGEVLDDATLAALANEFGVLKS